MNVSWAKNSTYQAILANLNITVTFQYNKTYNNKHNKIIMGWTITPITQSKPSRQRIAPI